MMEASYHKMHQTQKESMIYGPMEGALHLSTLHIEGMDDAKEIWEAIRTRFGGNANSKKMQKAVYKEQFEAFTISSSEGLEKGYDRFQQLLSQLEAHGAKSITEDANHNFLSKSSTNKGPQEPEPSVSDDRSSEYSTCQSNDSEGSIGTSSEHSVDSESENSSVPQEVYMSKPVTTKEKGVSAPKSKEVEPSCVTHIKTPRQQIKDQETPTVNRKNWNGIKERELGEGCSFIKKKCFVCGSLSHLIKDCDYYEKKMARETEFKQQRVVNTGNGVARPVWTNADRINHANQFVSRLVQLNAGRPNINSVRTNINTSRTNINSVQTRVNIVRQNVNSVRPK
ncbi:hypothetical protein Tco_0471818 [Tanacetum coccineum]